MSSFEPPKGEDLSWLLQKSYSPCRRRRNLLRMATVSLTKCYINITEQNSASSSYVDCYSLRANIGSGTFSEVYSAESTSGDKCALKILHPSVELLGLRELICLRYLNSKVHHKSLFFVRVKDCFMHERQMHMVMDLFQHTLLDFICRDRVHTSRVDFEESIHAPANILHPKFRRGSGSSWQDPQLPSEPPVNAMFVSRLRHVAARLCSALWVMKSEGVVHSDIKPENIFLRWDDGNCTLPSTAISNLQSRKRSRQSIEPSRLDLIPFSDFDVTIGDFGNAFHISESSKFYAEFEVQSMPYRAPEVLLGVPFGSQIDMWSLGIVLLELCLGRTLFVSKTREEQFLSMCNTLTIPPQLRFAGGLYSQQLFASLPDIKQKFSFTDHKIRVYNLLASRFSGEVSCPCDMLHFIASLVYPDPDHRSTTADALQHDFLACNIAVPRLLLNTSRSKRNTRRKGNVGSLRSYSSG